MGKDNPGSVTITRLAMGIAMLGVLAGCGGGATSATPSPTTASFPADEQVAINALHPGCTETDRALDAEAKKTLELMQKNGVKDETLLSVLQHLRQSIPPGTPDMNCANQLGAYVTLRGNGG